MEEPKTLREKITTILNKGSQQQGVNFIVDEIINLPELKAIQVEAKVMPNEVLADGKKRWKPKEKEIFYYVNFYTGVTEQAYTNSKIHTPRNLYKIGNCYKTKEEAQIKWDQIKKILLQR